MPYSQEYDLLAQQIASEVFGSGSELAGVFYRMMKQESGFDSDVVEGRRVSSAGAQGIAQFMPATAQDEGVDPLNPEQALLGAAHYLNKLIHYFGGEVAKGVAAYNAGAGRVENAVAAGGANWTSYLPTETQSYLQITQPEGVTTMPNGTVETGGVPGPQGPYIGAETPIPAPTGQTGLGFGAWTEQNDPHFPWKDRIRPDQPGLIGDAWLKTLSSQERAAKWEQYSSAMGESALTPAEQEAENLELAGQEIDLGLWPYTISQDEFDNTRQWYLDQVAAGKYRAEEATNRFYAWLDAQEEVGRRAETLMQREQKTLPTRYFPQTEPGGMLATVAGRYGVPFTPWEGVPVSQLTSPEEALKRFQGEMGVSAQAPELVSYNPEPVMQQYGQAVAAQGQGAQAALDFVRQMLARRGVAST